MIKIFDQQMNLKTIIDESQAGYKMQFNSLWTASFSFPADDPKHDECLAFRIAEFWDGDDYIDKFRIMPQTKKRDDSGKNISYECEHVLGTLLDDVLFQYHQTDNLSPKDTIDYLLGFQTQTNWVVGQVDFDYLYSYKWESDNILSALFSLTKPYLDEFMWSWDTSGYPWKLNLVKPPSSVSAEVRYRKNLKGISRETDPTNIITRIYPLGYGDGVNQLTIKDVNNGVPYIEKNTDLYGVISDVWVDKRYEKAQSLKDAGQSILDDASVPKITYQATASDLYQATKDPLEKFTYGALIHIIDDDLGIDFNARLMTIEKPDYKGRPNEITFDIENKPNSLSDQHVNLMDRQRINDTYAQGATNIDTHDYNDNCDPTHPAVIKFFIPNEMVHINKSSLSFNTEALRAYSKATTAAGSVNKTTTSASGGSVNKTTTSAAGGNHTHVMFSSIGFTSNGAPDSSVQLECANGFTVNVNDGTAAATDYSTKGASGDHTHNVSIDIPSHTHDVTIDIPTHTHGISYGIYEEKTLPTSITVEVDGTLVPNLSLNETNIDIISYLSKDIDGKVERGKFHEIKITPNDLGRINTNVINQFFIQSRGGGNY